MNILFFLTPKSDVAFIYSDANLREAIDLMGSAPLLRPADPYETRTVCRNADGR